MSTRQAILFMTSLSLLAGLLACSPTIDSLPTQTDVPSTPTATLTLIPSPIPTAIISPTPTPLTCLSDSGIVKQDVISTSNPPQEFLIYLPPCYENSVDARFPVLYLLHGQTYNQDQWVRLGVPLIADKLIHSEEAPPFIIIFPDDHYWNVKAGASFGIRFISDVIPYVDIHYRTLADRGHRSLGGLSRGGGWAIKLGFTNPELFGALGLHSPGVFNEDAPYIEKIIQNIPQDLRPQLWLDVGDADSELLSINAFEEILTRNDYAHKFHRYAGDHTEIYWSNHVEEYLRWYIQGWQGQLTAQ